MRHPSLVCLLVTSLLASAGLACGSRIPSSTCAPLGEFPGPEDFDLVTRDGRRQIIVSATERRTPAAAEDNGFWRIDWDAGREIEQLELHGRDGCWLAPHGIATAELAPGRWQLWAIMHYAPPPDAPAPPEACAGLVHGIEHFELADDGLHFIERITGPELTNPNDLDALPDGRLWLSNNPPWPGGKGLAGDVIFRRAKGQIVHYAPGVGLSVAVEGFVYPNGVHGSADGETLWVAASAGELFRVGLGADGHERAGERERLRVRPRAVLDNFLVDPTDGSLWVTGHPKPLAFIRHARRSDRHAPTVGYRVEPAGEAVEIEAIGLWTKGRVDAGSSVVALDDSLVLAQVFEPGLRVCEPTSAPGDP